MFCGNMGREVDSLRLLPSTLILPWLVNCISFLPFRFPWATKKNTMWKTPLIGWSSYLCSEYFIDMVDAIISTLSFLEDWFEFTVYSLFMLFFKNNAFECILFVLNAMSDPLLHNLPHDWAEERQTFLREGWVNIRRHL